MKVADLSPIKENDVQFQKKVETLRSKYKCDWSDDVHESYGLLVRQLEECSQMLRTIRCRTEILEKEAEALNIDELCRKADYWCREAESV